MRKTLISLLMASIIMFSVTGIENDSIGPEDIQSGEPAVCGDSVCQDIERGVCPQDCQKNGTTENKTASEDSESGIKDLVADNIVFITAISASTGIIFLISLLSFRKLGTNSGKDTGKIEEWVQEQLSEGYSRNEIRILLEEQGYSDEKINEIMEKTD